MRQDLPALKASVDSVDRQDNQQLRAATDLMRRLASAFCKDPVHVYARTRMPPTTYSAAFFQSVLDTRATRDQARALLSSSETIPGMAYWPRSQGPSSIFHLWNFFTAMVASKDDVAYALGKFDPSVFYVKQFRRPENVNVRELYFSAKPSVPSKCAPRNEGLLNKAFDMCGTCGIFPYRLLTMPMASLYHVLDENQMDYAQAIKLEDMSSVHYSALRNNSAVVNVIPGVKDPDLKKLHKMSGTSPQEQLVLIRQALIACFGTDVAAMLCEATLLRDPVMMKLSVATGEDIPFAAGRTMLFQPGYLGIVAEGTVLGDTQYKVKVENDRVYLVDGTRTLTESEAQSVVLSAIVREIRDNVLAFTEPMESSADKRMRVAEKYLMLNGKAMLDNMRHFKSTLDGWSKLHEAHDPRGVSLDSPELLLLTRVAGGATPQPCRRAFWEFRKWDLATPYAYSFEELLKARSKEENRDLYRILTRLSLLPDITPNHLPPVASDDCENGFEKYHGMPTFGPSLLTQNPEWRSLVEDFSEWCNSMIHLRNCAAAPGVMMSHMGLMNEGLRLRGADAPDPAAEPTFGLTDTDLSAGLCKDFVSQRQDGKLFSRFTPDADRDAECPHLGGDECVKTDLRKDEDEVKRTIDADVLIFSAGERQPDFNQADCHDLTYNTQDRPQFFSVMDACGLLWRERMFHNPAYTRSAIDKDKRVLPESGVGSLENMHYHARILAEAAAVARVEHDERCAHDLSQTYEVNVKRNPEVHFGVSLIGKMLDESFQALYPLQPLKGTLRRKLERVRSLPIMFATMDCYSSKLQGKSFSKVSTTGGGETPIWCPISHHHYYQLLQAADLFDKERKIPITPWTSMNKDAWDFSGLMHSSHSVLKVDRLTAEQYADYCTNHLKYQVPREDPEAPHVPFGRYGGTPVAADFIGAPVHKPAPGHEDRSAHLCQARFGHTGPLDLGELPFEDHGILQDAFAYSYRPSLRLSPAQVEACATRRRRSCTSQLPRVHAQPHAAGAREQAPQRLVRVRRSRSRPAHDAPHAHVLGRLQVHRRHRARGTRDRRLRAHLRVAALQPQHGSTSHGLRVHHRLPAPDPRGDAQRLGPAQDQQPGRHAPPGAGALRQRRAPPDDEGGRRGTIPQRNGAWLSHAQAAPPLADQGRVHARPSGALPQRAERVLHAAARRSHHEDQQRRRAQDDGAAAVDGHSRRAVRQARPEGRHRSRDQQRHRQAQRAQEVRALHFADGAGGAGRRRDQAALGQEARFEGSGEPLRVL